MGFDIHGGSWRLRTSFGDEVVVVRARDLRKQDEARRMPSVFLLFELREWLLGMDGADRATLMDMYREVRGNPTAFRFGGGDASDLLRHVLPELEEAFRNGRLVALKVPRRAVPAGLRPRQAAEAAAPPESEPADWVEIVVVYDNGEPYLGRYRLDLPDGRALSGQFNMGGAVRADGIPGGSCRAAFPDLHIPVARGT
jgi:hypothetical protein